MRREKEWEDEGRRKKGERRVRSRWRHRGCLYDDDDEEMEGQAEQQQQGESHSITYSCALK